MTTIERNLDEIKAGQEKCQEEVAAKVEAEVKRQLERVLGSGIASKYPS